MPKRYVKKPLSIMPNDRKNLRFILSATKPLKNMKKAYENKYVESMVPNKVLPCLPEKAVVDQGYAC